MTDTDERPAIAVPDEAQAPTDRASARVRRWLDPPADRRDPWPWLLAAAALVVSGLFLLTSLAYNQHRLIPPLDDVYIHLQYARQLGEGQFFRYNTGDPISTGASSFLYAFVLGLGWVIGLHGAGFLAWAVFVGVVCFGLTASTVYLIGRELGGRWTGVGAGLLTVTSGAFAWGATSGMEVSLVAALLTGSILAVVRETPAARFRLAPVLATLLALVRPEGLIMAAGLVVAMLVTIAGQRRDRHDRQGRAAVVGSAAIVVIPLVAGAAQLAFYRVATGSFQANGIQSKSWGSAGFPWRTEFLDHTLDNLRAFGGVLLGTTTWDLMPPGALLAAMLCLVALVVARPWWRPLAVAVGVGFVVVLISLSTLTTALWQDGRYLQPFLPLLFLLVVGGLHAGVRALGDPRARRITGATLFGGLLLCSLVVLPGWALRLGQQAATIREAPVSVARWLAAEVPRGASIAVNDVGATAYFSDHRIVDLIGLTTNGLARPANQGAGALYEALREMPPDQRPAWFSIYKDWPGFPVHDLANGGVLGESPVQQFTLRSPVRSFGALPPTCQSDRSCDQVQIWKADWSVAGTGDAPDTPTPGRIVDYLNVGSLTSEDGHQYQPVPSVVGAEPTTVIARMTAGNRRITDSGRTIVGGERFRLSHLTPGRPVTLTGRFDPREPSSDATIDSHTVSVTADGRPVGSWVLPQPPTGWAQATTVIPGNLVTGTTLDVELGPTHPVLAPFPDYTSYGYWASQ